MNRMLLPAAVIAAFFAPPLLAHDDDAAGDRGKARMYFEKLAALAKNADTDRAELREAKAFLLAQR